MRGVDGCVVSSEAAWPVDGAAPLPLGFSIQHFSFAVPDAQVLKFQIWRACESLHHDPDEIYVTYTDQPSGPMDVVITDSWSSSLPREPRPEWSLSAKLLHELGKPVLLPTPPFFIGKELAFDPTTYPNFIGYAQRAILLDVQRAVLIHMIEH